MGTRSRSVIVVSLAFLLLFGVMPAGAYGALTLTWVRNWGTYDGTAPYADGSFNGLGDVAADKWGNVYVTGGWTGLPDVHDDRVQMFNWDGDFIKKYDNPGTAATQLNMPRSITTDRWGAIYVSQRDNNRIEIFNPVLYNHLRTIDTPAPMDVTGIAVKLDGTIYDAQQWSNVEHRTWLGALIGAALTPVHPMAVAVSQDGEVFAACDYFTADDNPADMGQKITVYNADDTFKQSWGGWGTAAGKFDRPFDVGVDAQANVFVAEWHNDRVQALTNAGAPLAMVGTGGAGPQQFASPSGVGVGFDRTLYVADHGNNRVSKWKVNVPTVADQVAGASRITTAIEASKKAYPDGSLCVILATAANWPDALGGAALAGAAKCPLLLTNKDTLPAEVAAEITRLGAQHVYVLGGVSAISEAVRAAATALIPGGSGARLAGADRYGTAIAIADEVKRVQGSDYDGTAFVCTGLNFPDALAASPIAAANAWPIYLTPPDTLPAAVSAAMLANPWGNPTNHGYIIGGKTVVSEAVEATLNHAPFMGFGRFAGLNRYDTSAKVADIGFNGMGMLFSRPALATGENFPDALSGGVLQGSDASPILLTRSATLSPDAAAMLTKYKDHIYEIRFMGGNAVVTPAVQNAAKALLW